MVSPPPAPPIDVVEVVVVSVVLVEVPALPPFDVEEVVCPVVLLVVFGGTNESSAEQLMPSASRQGSATDVATNIRFIRSST
jgi:hypothetical protein